MLRIISREIRFSRPWYYLLGDFNCNLASGQYCSNTQRLCEISDLPQQLITEATRITKS